MDNRRKINLKFSIRYDIDIPVGSESELQTYTNS